MINGAPIINLDVERRRRQPRRWRRHVAFAAIAFAAACWTVTIVWLMAWVLR